MAYTPLQSYTARKSQRLAGWQYRLEGQGNIIIAGVTDRWYLTLAAAKEAALGSAQLDQAVSFL